MKKLIPYFIILLMIASCDTKKDQEEQKDENFITEEGDLSGKVKIEGLEAEVVKVNPIQYVGVSADVKTNNMEALGNTITQLYGKIMDSVEAENAPNGLPLSVYQSFGSDKIEVIIALQVPDTSNTAYRRVGEAQFGSTSEGYAIKGTHKGSYKNLLDTHDKIKNYISQENLQIMGNPFEIYKTGPSQQESDTTKWITEVYYPINKGKLKEKNEE